MTTVAETDLFVLGARILSQQVGSFEIDRLVVKEHQNNVGFLRHRDRGRCWSRPYISLGRDLAENRHSWCCYHSSGDDICANFISNFSRESLAVTNRGSEFQCMHVHWVCTRARCTLQNFCGAAVSPRSAQQNWEWHVMMMPLKPLLAIR